MLVFEGNHEIFILQNHLLNLKIYNLEREKFYVFIVIYFFGFLSKYLYLEFAS